MYMKLLIVTQEVNYDGDVLGFFHSWIKKFSEACERVVVVCLRQGVYKLPANTAVFSLGKEKRRASKILYAIRFYRHIWRERRNYDTVFVHMNQEYILLGAFLWRMWGKKILLWRNHPKGNWITNIAVYWADHVFATSPFAYTARFSKTSIMPAGIDTDLFSPCLKNRQNNSVLVLGRISPVKNVNLIVDAVKGAVAFGWNGQMVICGDAPARDREYADQIRLQAEGLERRGLVHFLDKINHHEAPLLYCLYELYINATPTGSLDKTMFEAMASGMLVLVSNGALRGVIPEECIFVEGDSEDLAKKMTYILGLPGDKKKQITERLRRYVIEKQSLVQLIPAILEYVKKNNTIS